MRTQLLPVEHGSSSSRHLDIEGFRITHARFPAGLRIPPHVHDQACLAVMLEGSFRVDFARTSRECAAGDAVIEPAGEKHGNRIAPAGSHVVVVQPDRGRVQSVRPLRELVDRIDRVRDLRIVRAAWSLAGEIDDPDPVTRLSAESLALEILATAARLETERRTARRPPAWLRRVREQLHDRFLEPLRIDDLAQAAGVHPVHLGKAFRACYGRPIASYLRDRRVEWAAARLSATDDPLCAIAAEAGFSDQSHFTRLFRRRFGTTPGRYRRRHRL